MSDTTAGLLVIVLVILILLSPLATIWALNTLFSLGLAYSFKNFVAVSVLQAILAAKTPSKKSN
jgi:hypothetical protein